MDEDRRIRFLIPPLLFVASLLLGAFVDQSTRDLIVKVFNSSESPDWPKLLIGLIAGGGIVVVVVGYVIGTFTYFVLRLVFYIKALVKKFKGPRFHESALSDEAFCMLWKRLDAPGEPDRKQELSAVVVFDHGVLREGHGIHRWVFRRWNAFSIGANSITGLVLSFLLGHFLIGIPCTRTWLLLTISFAIVLCFIIVWAWRDTMRISKFVAILPPSPATARSSSPT
jgi:hypothetical protein